MSGFVQSIRTVTVWMVGSVPVTVSVKSSQVELVQSAPIGSDVDSVKGPPPHVSGALPGDIVPLDGVAARDAGANKRIENTSASTRTGTGGTRRDVRIGDLHREKDSCRAHPACGGDRERTEKWYWGGNARTYQRASEKCVGE